MRLSRKLLYGRKVGYGDYQLTVEHSFFGLFPKVQVYRGHILWKRYPQGDSYWGLHMGWLDAQCSQFEWSQEHQ